MCFVECHFNSGKTLWIGWTIGDGMLQYPAENPRKVRPRTLDRFRGTKRREAEPKDAAPSVSAGFGQHLINGRHKQVCMAAPKDHRRADFQEVPAWPGQAYEKALVHQRIDQVPRL